MSESRIADAYGWPKPPVIVDAGQPLLTPEQQAAITAIIEHARASAGMASPGSLYGKAFVLAASFGHGETYLERDQPGGFEWLKIRWHRAKPASSAVD